MNNIHEIKKAPTRRGFFFILKKVLIGIYSALKATLYQSSCKLCSVDLVLPGEKILCNQCQSQLAFKTEPVCDKCGKRVITAESFCGECILNADALPYVRHLSIAPYEDHMRSLILKCKYAENRSLKSIALPLLLKTLAQLKTVQFDLIIPVPMDRGRERQYDFILDISRDISKKIGVALECDNLVKIRKTQAQAGLTQVQRKKNLNGAFQVRKPARLSGKTVLLVDDVYTTGTTIIRCSMALAKADATIYAITLARSL